MTANATRTTTPATPPGSAALYDIAAALAVTTANLADSIDDNRPDWLHLADTASGLLDALVITKADTDADGFEAAELYAAQATADLYQAAADLSATAGDIAANIAEGRACPGNVARARHLLDALTDTIGDGTDPAGFPPVALMPVRNAG